MKYDNGFKGEERRKNGGVKLTWGDWWKIVFTLIVIAVAFTEVRMTVHAQGDKIKKVEETPLKVAVIEEKVASLDKNFEEFKTDQKTWNGQADDKLAEILRAINGE